MPWIWSRNSLSVLDETVNYVSYISVHVEKKKKQLIFCLCLRSVSLTLSYDKRSKIVSSFLSRKSHWKFIYSLLLLFSKVGTLNFVSAFLLIHVLLSTYFFTSLMIFILFFVCCQDTDDHHMFNNSTY